MTNHLKKAVTIFILFLYVFSATELHQVMKLPILVGHFFEHQSHNSSLTIWAFLYLHYAQPTADSTDETHKKLPFKSDDRCVSSTPAIVFMNNCTYNFKPEIIFSSLIFLKSFNDNFLPSLYLSSIWQPPQSC
jgi:hypothetical protein